MSLDCSAFRQFSPGSMMTEHEAKHCPGCSGHVTGLTFTALDSFEIKNRGTAYVVKVPVGHKFQLQDIISITYENATSEFKIIGIEKVRQRCFDHEAQEAVALLTKAVIA